MAQQDEFDVAILASGDGDLKLAVKQYAKIRDTFTKLRNYIEIKKIVRQTIRGSFYLNICFITIKKIIYIKIKYFFLFQLSLCHTSGICKDIQSLLIKVFY